MNEKKYCLSWHRNIVMQFLVSTSAICSFVTSRTVYWFRSWLPINLARHEAARSSSSTNSAHDHAQFSLDNKRQRSEIKQEWDKIYAIRSEFLWNIQIAPGDTSVSIPRKCRAKIVLGDAQIHVAIHTAVEIAATWEFGYFSILLP